MMKKKLIGMMLTASLIITNLFSPQVFAEENTNINTIETESSESQNTEAVSNEKIITSIADNSKEMQSFNQTVSLGAYVVLDSKTGEVIMGKNENQVMYPASLTKVLTSLLLIENKHMDDILIASKEAASVGEASIYVRENESFTAKDLLYSMMLKSANDACVVVGEGISGSLENFYTLMNRRARQAGAINSNFASPHGLHDDNHYTTAYDLGMITKEAIKHPEFREAMGTQKYTLDREGDVLKTIFHTNRMIFSSKPEYNEYSLGGKTGFTYEAQNCLIEVAKKDDMEIIVVALKAAPGQVYNDTNRIINHALDNYISTPLLTATESVQEMNGVYLTYAPKEPVTYITQRDGAQTINSNVEYVIDESLQGFVAKDTVIGTANVYVNNGLYKSVDLVALEDVELPSATSFSLLRNALVIVGLILLIKTTQILIVYRKRKTENYLKKSNLY